MSEWHRREHSPITEDALIRAVHILADIVETSGPAFRPLYLDLRQQLANLREQQEHAKAKAAQGSTQAA